MAGVPVTVLRAAVVDRPRQHLLGDHPAARRPPAGDAHAQVGQHPTQPIALPDVVRYLVGVLEPAEARGRVFEIGGPDVLRYIDMLKRAGRGPGQAHCRT